MASVHGSCGVSRWSGDAFATKKSLREAVTSGEGIKVRILTFGAERTVLLNSEGIWNEPGTYYIAGPVAESDRRWYVELIVGANGKITVK